MNALVSEKDLRQLSNKKHKETGQSDATARLLRLSEKL